MCHAQTSPNRRANSAERKLTATGITDAGRQSRKHGNEQNAHTWQVSCVVSSAVIVGDDADLILMAMVSPTEHLYVANASLQREGITRSTPIFSVDALHAVWLKAQLLQPTTLQALVSPARSCVQSWSVCLWLSPPNAQPVQPPAL